MTRAEKELHWGQLDLTNIFHHLSMQQWDVSSNSFIYLKTTLKISGEWGGRGKKPCVALSLYTLYVYIDNFHSTLRLVYIKSQFLPLWDTQQKQVVNR